MRVAQVVSSLLLLACVGTAAADSGLRGGDNDVLMSDTVGGNVKPIHCQMKPWGPWSPCGIDGYKQRHREIDVAPNEHGRACPFDTDRIKCRNIDCVVCDWKQDACDKAKGTQRSWREIIRQPELDGEACPTELERFDDCDVDCEVYPDEFDVTPTCDENGDKWKYPKIKYQQQHHGAACPGPTKIPHACPPEDCKYKTKDEDTTTPFGDCVLDTSDNHYYKQRKLAIASPARYGGADCKDEDGLDKRDCAIDCEVYPGEFDETSCDVNGDTIKTPKVKVQPQFNGRACPPPEPHVGACPPEDCQYVPVPANTPYGTCVLEASSGKYFKSRDRVVAHEARYGGNACVPDKLECTRECGESYPGKEFLSSVYDLDYSAEPSETACCQFCKDHPTCKAYTYGTLDKGCYIVTSVDIIQNNYRTIAANVDWK